MIYMLLGYLHAVVAGKLRRIRMLAEGESGQGTVEYVGLILLVSLLMVGMVAAMKGFNRYFTKGGHYCPERTISRDLLADTYPVRSIRCVA